MALATWGSFGHAALGGAALLLSNPVFYLTLVVMIWDLTRSAKSERRFFGVRATKVWRPLMRRFLLGILVGILGSVVLLATGVVVHREEIWVLTVLTVLLALIRMRFSASGYSLAVLLILALIGKVIPLNGSGPLHALQSFVAGFQVDSWLGLAAVLFFVEAILLRLSTNEHFAPAVVMTKRGRAIGAAVLQLPFLIPVLCVSPGHLALPPGLPASWPWLGSTLHGYTFVGMPLLAGFSAVLLSIRGREAIRLTSQVSLVVGVLLAFDALAVHLWGIALGWVGVLILILGRELPIWLVRQREMQKDPLFSPSSAGVRILTTREGSLAQTMGLLPGEIVTHVNQVPVHSTYDLHFAFDQNPAYAKLQVVDERGEVRIVGKPVYTGELNQLGLILAPDQPTGVSYGRQEFGLFQSLYLRVESVGSRSEVRSGDSQLEL